MKITDVEAIVLALPTISEACDGTQDTCLIKITTDEGLEGWGEVDSCPTVIAAVVNAPVSHQICRGLRESLLGLDPLDIPGCMQTMDQAVNYFGRTGAGAHAQAGVNIALWDLLGKARQQPISELLGVPKRTEFRAYCSILFGDTPEQTADLARTFARQGFTAVKFGWGPMGEGEQQDIELVRAARDGLGDEIDLLVDAGQVWDWRTALKRAEAFSELGVYWLEEPLHPEDIEGYRQLSAVSPIPIAAAEAEARFVEFERLITQGGIHWVQPDPGRCGISNFVKAGQLADSLQRNTVNHSFKSGITIAASLHALSAIENTELAELCMADSPLRHELTHEVFSIDENGLISIPQGPGLGVTINESTVQRYRIDA